MRYMSIPCVSIDIALPHDLLRGETEQVGVGIFSFFDLPDEACTEWSLSAENQIAVLQAQKMSGQFEGGSTFCS